MLILDNCALVSCCTVSSGSFLPIFWDNLSVPSSGVKKSLDPGSLKSCNVGSYLPKCKHYISEDHNLHHNENFNFYTDVHTAVCVAGCWTVVAGKQVGVTLLKEKCAVRQILSMCVCLCYYQHSKPVINVFVKSTCAVLYCSSCSIM
jgi:hypothetical protein